MRLARGAMVGLSAALLAGCAPLYLSQMYTTSTPRPPSSDLAELTRGPVATLGPLAPAGLQGYNPFLAHALVAALTEASPSIRGMPAHEALNALNEHGLAAEYSDLIAGFARSGIPDRERLHRIGSALGSRYAFLPGVAALDQFLIDKFEVAGFKVVRNRVVTLRLWLQLWDTETGRILWESAGEATVASDLVTAAQAVPLDAIAQRLWLRMVQDDLLGSGSDRDRAAEIPHEVLDGQSRR